MSKAIGVDFVLRGGGSKIEKCVFQELLNRDKNRTRQIFDFTRFKGSSLLCGNGWGWISYLGVAARKSESAYFKSS